MGRLISGGAVQALFATAGLLAGFLRKVSSACRPVRMWVSRPGRSANLPRQLDSRSGEWPSWGLRIVCVALIAGEAPCNTEYVVLVVYSD